jgi:periplasmic protein TonB
MDFAQHQRSPTRHLVSIGGVILLHVLIIWALVTGLARKVVEVVKGPIEVKVIEETIKKPPPPPEVIPPPPKMQAPPPPFVPPPEVVIQQPPPAPTITAVTPEPPPAPQAPVITKPVEAPPAPPPPPVRSAQVVCGNYRDVLSSTPYPREALRDNIQGEVVVEFTLTTSGAIRDAVIKSSSNRVFNRAALNSVQNRLKCQGQSQDLRLQVPFSFTIR